MLYRLALTSLLLVFCSFLFMSTDTLWRTNDKMNVMILSVESLRADLLTSHNAPNLLKAATTAAVYPNHRGASAWTGAGIVSLLTGLSPFDHHVNSGKTPYAYKQPSALNILKEKGWEVAGLQPFMNVGTFGNLGLDIQTGSDLTPWLSQRAQQKTPFLLWYHYLDTHLPYRQRDPKWQFDWRNALQDSSPARLKRIEAVASYPNIPAKSFQFEAQDSKIITEMHAASVREFDAWFAKFWDFFNKSGLSDNTILVLTADHGDEHGERGNVGHASTTKNGHLYEELIRLPLMIWTPQNKLSPLSEGETRNWTTHTDIMPFLFKQLELPSFNGWKTHKTIWLGLTTQAGFAENDLNDISRYRFAAFDGRWKLHAQQNTKGEWTSALYDLQTDPDEKHNIATINRNIHDQLLATIKQRLKTANLTHVSTQPQTQNEFKSPQWLTPKDNTLFQYDDIADTCFRLQWSDVGASRYTLEFKAGTGALATNGNITVEDHKVEYCDIGYLYWKTFITPYKQVQLRIAPSGTTAWSKWLTLGIKEED